MSIQERDPLSDCGKAAEKATSSPSPVKIHELLGTARRYYTLEVLLETEGGIEFSTLVDRVAARENQTSIEELDHGARKSVKAGLHQSHLPKLKDEGVVEYTRVGVNEMIRLGPEAQSIEPYLSVEERTGNFVDSVRSVFSL